MTVQLAVVKIDQAVNVAEPIDIGVLGDRAAEEARKGPIMLVLQSG